MTDTYKITLVFDDKQALESLGKIAQAVDKVKTKATKAPGKASTSIAGETEKAAKKAAKAIAKITKTFQDEMNALARVNAKSLSTEQVKAFSGAISSVNRKLFKLRDELQKTGEYNSFDRLVNSMRSAVTATQEETKATQKLQRETSKLYQMVKELGTVRPSKLPKEHLQFFGKDIEKASALLYKMRKTLPTHEFKYLTRSIDRARISLSKMTVPATKFNGLLYEWWKRFGQVALGFTVMYRAMNLFEDVLTETFDLFKEGIKLSGELAAQQGKLATYYTIAAKGSANFNQAMKLARRNIIALRDASLNVASSLEEVITAYDEVGIHGGNVPKRLIPAFASLTDFTLLIAQTSGDSLRQLRSELNALFTGQMKKTNILINFMTQFGLLTKEQVANLRHANDGGKRFIEILDQIKDPLTNLSRILLQADPGKAFLKWRDALKQVIATAVDYVSVNKKQLNIFAAITQEHKERILAWTKDEKLMKKFVVTINAAAKGYDLFLSSIEKGVRVIANLVTAFQSLSPVLKPIIKYFVMFEATMASWKLIKFFGSALGALNSPLLRLYDTMKKLKEVDIAATLVSLLNPKLLLTATAVLGAFSLIQNYRYNKKHLQQNKDLGDPLLSMDMAHPESLLQQKGQKQKRPGFFKSVFAQTQDDIKKMFSWVLDTVKLPKMAENKEMLKLITAISHLGDDATKKTTPSLSTSWFSRLKRGVAHGSYATNVAKNATLELKLQINEYKKQIQLLKQLKSETTDPEQQQKYVLKTLELQQKIKETTQNIAKIQSGTFAKEAMVNAFSVIKKIQTKIYKEMKDVQKKMFDAMFDQSSQRIKTRNDALEFATKMKEQMKELGFTAKEAAPYLNKIADILEKYKTGKEKFVERLQAMAGAAKDSWTQASDSVVNAIGQMENALVSFVETGKISFKSLVNSIINDMARITVQQAIMSPLETFTANAVQQFLPAMGGAISGGANGSIMPTTFEGLSLSGSTPNINIQLQNSSGAPLSLTKSRVSYGASAQEVIVQATIDAKQRNVNGFRFA